METYKKAAFPLLLAAFATAAFVGSLITNGPDQEEPVIAEEDQKYVEQCTETSGFKVFGIRPETSTINANCIKMAKRNDILENGTSAERAAEMARMEEEFTSGRTSYFGKLSLQ